MDDNWVSLSVSDLNPHRRLIVKIVCSRATSALLQGFLIPLQTGCFAFACILLTRDWTGRDGTKVHPEP